MIAAERPRGVLSRQLILGDAPDTDRVQASYTAGVLTLRIPVAEKAKPRKITVTNAVPTPPALRSPARRHPMARHVVHRRNGQVDEYQELPATEHLEPDLVTVTFPDGSLRSYHVENGLGGVGFEFAPAGILVLRFEDSDHLLTAFAPTAWTSVTGTALGDRGRRSSSGR